MQAPTFAEFETFRKVSTWISDQAPRLASAPPCELVEDKPIPSPLDIFQRFPDGASQRTLENASRAFRRFSSKVVAGCASRAQRKAAWRKVGVDLILGENGRVLLHFVGLPGAESSPVRADPRERARARTDYSIPSRGAHIHTSTRSSTHATNLHQSLDKFSASP